MPRQLTEGCPCACVQTRGSSSLMWDFKGLPQCNPPKSQLLATQILACPRDFSALQQSSVPAGICWGDSFNILLKSLFQEVPWSWGGMVASCRAEQGHRLPAGQVILG